MPSKAGWEEEAAALCARMVGCDRELAMSSEAEGVVRSLHRRRAARHRKRTRQIDLYLGPRAVASPPTTLARRAAFPRRHRFRLETPLPSATFARSACSIQHPFQGETPIGIMYAAVIPTVRNLLVVQDLMKRHRLTVRRSLSSSARRSKSYPPKPSRICRARRMALSAFPLGVAASHAHRYQARRVRAPRSTPASRRTWQLSSILDSEAAGSAQPVCIDWKSDRPALKTDGSWSPSTCPRGGYGYSEGWHLISTNALKTSGVSVRPASNISGRIGSK
jgi:hypothetical protein